ncbi:hypothetical protein, partial [Endothiovibrio diazotrophicus]
MVAEPVGFEDALAILDVRDPSRLTEADFTRLMRRARRRWHPDTIAALQPSPEQVARYTRNFRLINPTLEVLRDYVSNRHFGDSTASIEPDVTPPPRPRRPPPPPPPEPPEEVIRRNASTMQEELRRVGAAVQRTGYKMHEEEFTAWEGWTVPELLQGELTDEVPVVAVSAVWGVGLLCV